MALLAGLATLIAVSSAASAPERSSSSWPKVTRLRDGSSVSVWRNGRVAERRASGKLESLSFCGSYTRYAHWVRFLTTFRGAVLTQDHARIAATVDWPLSWNHGRPWHTTAIQSQKQLLRLYRQVFAPSVTREIKVADPRALFCKNISQVALGQGVVWGDEPGGRLAIISINSSY